jgi:hypothetical protein
MDVLTPEGSPQLVAKYDSLQLQVQCLLRRPLVFRVPAYIGATPLDASNSDITSTLGLGIVTHINAFITVRGRLYNCTTGRVKN